MKKVRIACALLLALLLLFPLCVLPSAADEEDLIEAGSDWELLIYEESTEGLTAEEPDGWLDKTDGETWEVLPAPFAAPQWAKPYAATLFDFQYYSAFLRTTVNITNAGEINSLIMSVIYDEAPRLYINGTEVWSKGPGVYHDSGYTDVDLTEFADLLVDGENIICVFFCNLYGGGLFDMSLTVGRGEKTPVLPVDDEGHVKISGVSTTGFVNFGSINDPENVLDMDETTVTGSAFDAGAEQSVTLEFLERTAISEVFVQCKEEGTTTNDDGSRGTYKLYAYDGEEEIELGIVKAFSGTDGGASLTLDEPVDADSVKIVIVSWEGDCWACVADAYVVAADSATVEPTPTPVEPTPTPVEPTPTPVEPTPTPVEPTPTPVEPTPTPDESEPTIIAPGPGTDDGKPAGKLPGWAIAAIVAGGVAVVAAVVVTIVLVSKKKK